MARTVTVADIFSEVDGVLAKDKSASWAAAFDADGTLWSGDVGEEAFERATAAGLLDLEVLREPITRWAARYGLALPDNLESVVSLLQEALYSGDLVARGERLLGQDKNTTLTDVYGLHAWCYAGHTVDEIRAFGESVFTDVIASGVFAHTRPLIEGFRARGVRVVVVSASPRPLVEVACRHFDVPERDVVGMRPASDDAGVILPELEDAVYGPGKVTYLERALAQRGATTKLIAAFGDSVVGGDRELLEKAKLPIGVATSGAHREAALTSSRMLLLDP